MKTLMKAWIVAGVLIGAAPDFGVGFAAAKPAQTEDQASMQRGWKYWLTQPGIAKLCSDTSLRDCRKVSGPGEFLKDLKGVLITGRVKLVRFGKGHELPVDQYAFDPSLGHVWSVRYEYLFWDSESLSFRPYWTSRGENDQPMSVALDYDRHPPQSSEAVAGSIDWTPFKKIYYQGGIDR